MTLDTLLESRDRRAAHQRKLLEEWPASTLVCITVQLPGPIKRDSRSLLIGGAGMAALLDKFGSVLQHVQVKDLETGYEAYLIVPLPAALVKKMTSEIEETHPIGRLMDIDVITSEGPLDRAAIGLPPRRCLLCDNEARYCMRAKTHTPEELWARINHLIKTYLTNEL
ncbi:MAG: citrate lyase holo-[acyl-carrier protein] synthase [Bacteroidales bacterium]|nr:citrate lyase holo-[acyl-carrier protein] synthase [Bacteroidales bacterium]